MKPASRPKPSSRARRADAAPTRDEPFRMPPPPPDFAPVIVGTVGLAMAIIADLLGLHGTCPRRACRKSCDGGSGRMCQALFPPLANDMLMAIYLFAITVAPGRIEALQEHLSAGQPGVEAEPLP